ncbi:MAG: LysR family transcriptional regulator [Nocardioidaceae bacterium]|nr:LysR family transcriptional regulator [Nocardioidaceae bacterium]
MIDLDALVSLRAVQRHGSVVAAAAALGFTPSAVSQQVKRLERQVGLPLLERIGRGVILSGTGRQLVEDGGRLLTDLERIESGLHGAAGTVTGHLRMAAFSTVVRGLVAPAVGRVLRAHPDLTLTITEHEPWDAVDLVADGHADVGVVHSWGDVPIAVPEHLVSTFVARDVADVIVPADHPLAGRRRVRAADLVDVGWIATPEGTICRQWLHRMYDGTGSVPRIAHVSVEFDSHLALVRAGLGVALVPRLGRAVLPDDVVAIEAHDPVPSRTITALHRRSMDGSPAVRAVVAALAG